MHPQRYALHNEIHARPSIYFDAPAQVFHLAFLDERESATAIVHGLCDRHLALADPELPRAVLPIGNARLTWERHTEFLTLTLVAPRDPETRWPALPAPLAEPAETYGGLLINADQLCVESESRWLGAVESYGLHDVVGSTVADGGASVWSDLRLNGTGLNRILVLNRTLDRRRLGRMVRRLLEIETYRLMASLTLPIARDLQPELRQYENELAAISDANAGAAAGDVKLLLDRITRLSARITQSTVRNQLRFSATEAYEELVFERITQLHEGHTGDCQRLGSFISQRFRPTVRYCASTHRRLVRIGGTVADLSNLLQARVQVEIEGQNSEILRNLNTRAETQIKLQRAVEGLSIIAISYYLIGLLVLLYRGTRILGATLSPRTALLLGAPLVVVIVGAIAYRISNVRRH